LYLKKFYESHGFVQTSEMYLEDDIPHWNEKNLTKFVHSIKGHLAFIRS
jgi:predicted GNAT family N-acyltransferase